MRPSINVAWLGVRLADPIRRQEAIDEIAIACRAGVAAGARVLGICERTLWRWRASVPELGEAIDRSRGVR